jgi:hypothetical protein
MRLLLAKILTLLTGMMIIAVAVVFAIVQNR